MDEKAINIKIPTEVWDMVERVIAGRTLKGKPTITKKALVAKALEDYCEKEGVKK